MRDRKNGLPRGPFTAAEFTRRHRPSLCRWIPPSLIVLDTVMNRAAVDLVGNIASVFTPTLGSRMGAKVRMGRRIGSLPQTSLMCAPAATD